MKYLTSKEISKIWKISDRSVRNYCQQGRVPGSFLDGKIWMIPEEASKPIRQIRHIVKERTLLDVLLDEKSNHLKGGIYHRLQIEMTYNSNLIEGSKLSHDQTKHIFETKTIGIVDGTINVDDIIETVNHFACIDLVIDLAKTKLNESIIKQLYFVLKSGTFDNMKPWFKVGDYKIIENEVGGMATTLASKVKEEVKKLLAWYNSLDKITIESIIEFHKRFEAIHPFQDG